MTKLHLLVIVEKYSLLHRGLISVLKWWCSKPKASKFTYWLFSRPPGSLKCLLPTPLELPFLPRRVSLLCKLVFLDFLFTCKNFKLMKPFLPQISWGWELLFSSWKIIFRVFWTQHIIGTAHVFAEGSCLSTAWFTGVFSGTLLECVWHFLWIVWDHTPVHW